MCSFWNPPHRRRGRLSSSVTARWVICGVVMHTCTARCAGCPSLRWTAFCRAVSALTTTLDRPWKHFRAFLSSLSPGFPYPPMLILDFRRLFRAGRSLLWMRVRSGRNASERLHASVLLQHLSAPEEQQTACLAQRRLFSTGPATNPDQTRGFQSSLTVNAETDTW